MQLEPWLPYQNKVNVSKNNFNLNKYHSVNLSFSTYLLTAFLRINDLERSFALAITSIFCRSSSSISKHTLVFITSILYPLILKYLLLLYLILNILNYYILFYSIRKLYIVLEPNRILSRGSLLLAIGRAFFSPSFSPKHLGGNKEQNGGIYEWLKKLKICIYLFLKH